MLDNNKAILIGVCLNKIEFSKKENCLKELARLTDTAGLEVVGQFIQNRQRPDAAFYAGKGFLEKVINETGSEFPGVLIFDNELSASQNRNIEKEFELEAIDRTEVILNIFHEHARSREAQLQVRLAELQYQLPRLKKLWSHLDREKGRAAGMSGAARGMGEKQIEVDRRIIRHEISQVKKELVKVDRQKEIQRNQRDKIKKVCLIGYTNAGKSTLFNRLTDAGVLVEDKLFATLETTTRKLKLSKGRDLILSDTVGFISDLPHHLIASFRATLQDVRDADLLLHIIDISDDNFENYIEEVNKVLVQIDAEKIPQFMVLNKLDKVDPIILKERVNSRKKPILVSAKSGENIAGLLDLIDDKLHNAKKYKLLIPHTEQKTVNNLHKLADIENVDYLENGVSIIAVINREDLSHFVKYVVSSENI
ncbi:MAG: GTPase HflX [Candidatus Cloacimonetes bacterium]|nr:GTPase HflX [Candidatus Cloacimonadota bacterium]